MIFQGLFRQKKPKRFSYTPVFYDPEKDKKSIKGEIKRDEDSNNPDNENYAQLITKGSFRNYHHSKFKRTRKIFNTRLIIIVLIICILTYILFFR